MKSTHPIPQFAPGPARGPYPKAPPRPSVATPSRFTANPLDRPDEQPRAVESLSAGELIALRTLLADLGQAARRYRFEVAPNPCVGACVLSSGVEIGRGFHLEFGGPHAEVQALRAAAKSGVPRERWDTLVCTLEPCSTEGKTPACRDAIAEAGLRRCIVGELDPDIRHRGLGLKALRERAVEVTLLSGASPLGQVSPHFLSWTRPERLRRKRPWTIAKWAQTRTGQLRPPSDLGEGRWISGPSSLAEVHQLRARVDAIVTGRGTVLADDPRLTVRLPAFTADPPIRVVMDALLRTSPGARLFENPGEGEAGGAVHIIARAGVDPRRARELHRVGATIHTVRSGDDGQPSLREVQGLLWALGVRRVLVEAGPTLLTSCFRAEFVDQVRVYTGAINGGEGGGLAEWLAPERLLEAEHAEVGVDARLDAFVRS